MTNVLVIGGGSIAEKHILNLIKLKFIVYSLTSNDNFLNDNKDIKKIKSIDKAPNILFAIIANSTNKHLKYMEILAKKKIHIYCEKPIFHKAFNYLKLKNLITKNNIHFFVGYQLLQDTKVKYIKEKLKKQIIKSFIATVGHNYEVWRKNKPRKESYYNKTSLGGGVIFELVHEINLIRNLIGDIEEIKSFKSQFNQDKCELLAVSIIKTKNKILGTLYQDMLSKNLFRNLKIITNKVTYDIDFKKNIIFENEKKIVFKDNNSQISLLEKNICEFIKLIKKRKKDSVFYDSAVNDLKNCLIMHKNKVF